MNLSFYRFQCFFKFFLFGVFLIILILMNQNLVYAQNTGKISGVVLEASNKNILPGANILIEGSNKGAATGQNGRFNIFDLQPGTYTLTATFLGYQDSKKEVTVSAGQLSEVSFELEESILTGDEIVVYGELARGQAKALQRQKECAVHRRRRLNG